MLRLKKKGGGARGLKIESWKVSRVTSAPSIVEKHTMSIHHPIWNMSLPLPPEQSHLFIRAFISNSFIFHLPLPSSPLLSPLLPLFYNWKSGITGTRQFIVLLPKPHAPVPCSHLYSFMPVASLPSRCILILMVIRCKFIEVQRGGDGETGPADGIGRGGDNDWLGQRSRESEGETGGWGMVGGRRRRGEINMALIVSFAPLPSLDQTFITPLQSVQLWHFGKWGPPLTPSLQTAATYCM